MTATQDDVIAELQRANAELRRERDAVLLEKATLAEELTARTAELADRRTEFDERIEHQSATIDVLKAMSASPGNAQPVFDLIARQAANQCNVPTTAVATYDGTMMHLASESGLGAAYVAQFPRPVGLDFSMGRAVLNRRVDQVEDITAYPGHSFVDVLGNWSVMAVPILRNDVPLGAIAIGRPAIGPFSASQVALLQTFAEQAVIAIGSAETYRVLQTRTSDLQESLEYQTATSDVLKVIGGSTFDLQPVFDTIVTTAARLCEAGYANITTRGSDGFRVVAGYSNLPDKPFTGIGRSFPVDRNSITGRTVLAQQFVHLVEVTLDPEYSLLESARRTGMRSILGVPLIRDGVVVGTLNLGRVQVRPFTGRQIALIRTFADQAVIAMENARLITETREALERQTAMAEVLQVINASPGNLAPVFDTILAKALRLCEAEIGVLHTYDGDLLRLVATRGVPPALVDYLIEPHRPPPGGNAHRIVLGENIVHVDDIKDSDAYRSGDEARRAHVDLGGGRTAVYVALRKDNALLG